MKVPNKKRVLPFGAMIGKYASAQGLVQFLAVANGLLLLRILDRSQYAAYALAVGVQLTLGSLTDLGFGGSIVALVGNRGASKSVVGKYVKAASTIRLWLISLVVLASFAAGPYIARRSNLSTRDVVLLITAIIAALYFQGWSSYYDAPLLINRRVWEYYKPQIISGGMRLALILILWSFHLAGAVAAIWIATSSYVLLGVLYRRASRDLIEMPHGRVQDSVKEMIAYMVPLLPGTLYAALGGQISLFLIGIFGHTHEISSVAALGRLGQVFLLLSTANGVLVGPALARASSERLFSRYLTVLNLVLGACTVIFLVFWVFPGSAILLLGKRYSDVTGFVPLAVSASCLSCVSGAMWAMHAARKWVFWWGGSLQLLSAISVQLLCIRFLDLSTVVGVLKMNLYIVIVSFAVQVAHAVVGFRKRSLLSLQPAATAIA